jgi:hypothetical protein
VASAQSADVRCRLGQAGGAAIASSGCLLPATGRPVSVIFFPCFYSSPLRLRVPDCDYFNDVRFAMSASASWWPVRGRSSLGDTDLVPKSAVEVEVVASGLAGSGVADVGVQRVPVVGELFSAVGSLDRGDPAWRSGAGR